jgi:hypothetical protein
MDRLVQLFKEADDQSSWVRVPVIKFLKECPLPEAKQHIEELAKIDPKVVQQANSYFPLVGAPAPPAQSATTDSAATTETPASDAPATLSERPSDETTAAVSDSAPTATTTPAETAEANSASETKLDEKAEDASGTPSDVAVVTPPALDPEELEPAQPAGAIKSESSNRTAEIRENPWMTTFWVLAIPLGVGVVLMGLLLIILRGQRPTPTT